MVSIPFKRERLSERGIDLSATERQHEFQFPSNGKGFPNKKVGKRSIIDETFQFPSNGKGFPNAKVTGDNGFTSVFQFPSNGKGFPNL